MKASKKMELGVLVLVYILVGCFLFEITPQMLATKKPSAYVAVALLFFVYTGILAIVYEKFKEKKAKEQPPKLESRRHLD